jgi:uncharacterized protein (DUF885 family)
MRAIMRQVGFEGTLQEFFEFTRTDPRFYAKSREVYLSKVDATVLEAMEAKLPEYFATLPTDPLVVKPVEAFREKSAGKAFYQRPAPDGSRPGTYYVNLYDLNDMSLNELEALAYHEGLPGHHLQRRSRPTLATFRLPPLRRSHRLQRGLGPLFGGAGQGHGLLHRSLFRLRPAADGAVARRPAGGRHRHPPQALEPRAGDCLAKSREHAESRRRHRQGDRALHRLSGPGDAYMIGKLKIMELREKARAELGEQFDIRGFHDAVLLPGPVPLDILEENVEAWVANVQAT